MLLYLNQINVGGVLHDIEDMHARAMTSDEYDTKGRYKTNIRRMREYVEFIHQLDYCKTSVMAIGDGIAFSVIDNV